MDLTEKAKQVRKGSIQRLVYRNLIRWTALSSIGSNKWFKSSYFWMLFVPLAASVFNKVDKISIPFLNNGEGIQLSLPFTWQVFFFTSTFFSLATLIYSLNCPLIIKEYRNAQEFSGAGNSYLSLYRYYRELVDEDFIWISNTAKVARLDWLVVFSRRFFEESAIHQVSADNIDTRDLRVFWSRPLDGEGTPKYSPNLQTAFNELRELADYTRGTARLLCFGLYVAAFSFLALLLIENVLYVYVSIQE